MPATSAFTAFGSKLQYLSTPSPAAYTAVSQLRTIKFGGFKTADYDISNMDSPSAVREKIPGLIDAGDISFDGVLPVDPTSGGYGQLKTLLLARSTQVWQVIEPTSTLTQGQTSPAFYEFSGFVSELSTDFDYNKESVFSGKITITGTVVGHAAV